MPAVATHRNKMCCISRSARRKYRHGARIGLPYHEAMVQTNRRHRFAIATEAAVNCSGMQSLQNSCWLADDAVPNKNPSAAAACDRARPVGGLGGHAAHVVSRGTGSMDANEWVS